MTFNTVEEMSIYSARTNMIKQQLRTNNVLNESIIELFDVIPREDFVPSAYRSFAHSDMQIPLSHQQKMLTPTEEGLILQALDLKGHETVLEVGTGSGFFTALLSKLCKKVLSIDYYAEFTAGAATHLAAQGCTNVTLITGDASRGWLEHAPYDVIVFTGAMEKLTETHRLQVLPGGKLFALEGKSPVVQAKLYSLSHNEIWTDSLLFETDIPPLVDHLKPKVFKF